jgi:hypothetical protein
MKSLNGQINLRVINNTALPQPVSILSILPNQNTANNNNILYEFNFASQSFVFSMEQSHPVFVDVT